MPAHTSHQCLWWPCCWLWPVQGHQEGTGVQSGSKTWTQMKQKTFPTDDSQPFLSRQRGLHFEKLEEHIHPSLPLLLLQKESLMGKEFFNMVLKHSKERSLLLHILEINITNWQICWTGKKACSCLGLLLSLVNFRAHNYKHHRWFLLYQFQNHWTCNRKGSPR